MIKNPAQIEQLDKKPHLLKAKHYLLAGFVFFFIILSFMEFLLMYTAKISDTGVVIDGSKREQMQYNSKLIAARQKQELLGWQGNIDVQQNASFISVIFTLKDSEGKNVICNNAKAILMRPVTAKYDKTIVLDHKNQQYVGGFKLPLPGQWDIHIDAICNYEVEFSSDKRIIAQFDR